MLGFANFVLGGYHLQNGITGLIIEAEKQTDYRYLGNWTSFKMIYILLLYNVRLLRNPKFKCCNVSFVAELLLVKLLLNIVSISNESNTINHKSSS